MKDSENVANSSPSKSWSETRKGRIVVLAGVAGLFVLVFWLATKSRQMLAEPAALAIDEQYLSFGEVWEVPAFVWKLPIHNTTSGEIVIATFNTSCLCSKIEPPSLTIPAQGTAEVSLTLNLISAHSEPNLAGKDFKVAIQPQTTKGNGPQLGWVVQGKVKQPFALNPPKVDFEESLVRGQSFAPRAATIVCGLDVAELTVQCDSRFVAAKVWREEKNPRRFRVEVQPRKDMPSGLFNHGLRIIALTPNKLRLFGMIPVTGRVREDVGIQPESLTFGAKPLGAKVEEMVLLSSRGGWNFDVQEIDKGNSAGITVSRGEKRKDGSQIFFVSLSVENVGNCTQTIYFKTRTPEGKLNLPLIVSGCGVRSDGAAKGK